MKSPKATLRLIGLAAFASVASMRICDAMLIVLSQEFQVTTGEASRVISAFAVSYGALQLFYGPLGERLGKLQVVLSVTFACALVSTMTALAPNLQMLVLCRAAMGAAAAGIVPLAMAWVGDSVPYDKRQETLASLMGFTLTGMMAGQWFGGYAAETMGWRAAFMLLAGIFLVAAVVLYRYTAAERAAHAAGEKPAVSLADSMRASIRLLAVPRVRWVLAVVAVEGALAYGAMAFMPARLAEHFGFSLTHAGAVMVLLAIGGLSYSQFAKRWLAWLGEKGLALLGGLLFASALAVLAWGHVPWLAAGACYLAGLGLYMMHNTLQTQATQMAPQSRGSAVTLFACILFLGQSVGTLLMAESVDGGALAPAFTVAGIGMLLLGAWISRHVQPRKK